MLDVTTQHLFLAAIVAALGIIQTWLHNRNASDIAALKRQLAQCRAEIHDLRNAFAVSQGIPPGEL